MKSLFNIPAEITCNGIIKYDTFAYANAIKELAKPENRNVRIVLVEDFKDVTKKQLSYYHGFLLSDLCSAYESIGCSMDKKEMDKEIRNLFLYYYKTDVNSGRSTKVVMSLDKESSNFPDTKMMSEFFENIVQHCAMNLNYVIQLPSDIKENNLNFNR